MPPNREDLVIQRILIRHGFTRAMADELLLELERTIEHLSVRRAGHGEWMRQLARTTIQAGNKNVASAAAGLHDEAARLLVTIEGQFIHRDLACWQSPMIGTLKRWLRRAFSPQGLGREIPVA